RRPGRGHQLRADQDRRPGPQRPVGQVQPAPAHRRAAGRGRRIPRRGAPGPGGSPLMRPMRRRWLGQPWLAASLVALLAVLVLGAFPVRAWMDQGHQRDQLAARVAALTRTNDDLTRQAEELKDPNRVEALARERYELVRPGEEAYAILPTGEPPASAAPPAAASPAPSHPGWWSRTWS